MPHDHRGFLHDAIPDILADDFLWEAQQPPGFDDWRERVTEVAYQNAESRCIYTADELRVIEEYETHVYAPDNDEIDDYGTAYTTSQWQQARSVYAQVIAVRVLERLLEEAIGIIEENAGLLPQIAARLGADPDEAELALTASRTNPLGWAAHSHEAEDEETGLYYYACTHGQLDGLNGIATQVEGVWLSIVWAPAPAEAEEEGVEEGKTSPTA